MLPGKDSKHSKYMSIFLGKMVFSSTFIVLSVVVSQISIYEFLNSFITVFQKRKENKYFVAIFRNVFYLIKWSQFKFIKTAIHFINDKR